MSNKRLIKQIAAVGGAACLALTILVSPIATIPVQAAAPREDTASPQYDVILWRYKVVNGNLYRRLYNYAISEWIGEWEYIGPYNGPYNP